MEQYVHLMPLGPEKRTFILGTNGTIVIRKSPPPPLTNGNSCKQLSEERVLSPSTCSMCVCVWFG